MFCKLEYFFGLPSFSSVCFGISNVAAILITLVSARIAQWMLFATGVAFTYDESARHMDKFKAGQVDHDQRRLSSTMSCDKMYLGDIQRLEPDGVRLRDGRFIETEILLLCTSYSNGPANLSFTKDGRHFNMLDHSLKLWHHFSVQKFPVFAPALVFLTDGPQRICANAEIAVYQLCCTKPSISLSQIERSSLF